MTNLVVFVRQNWLVLLLAVGLVVMGILFVTRSNRTQNVAIQAAPEMMYQAPGVRAEAPPANTIEYCFRLDGNEGGHIPHLIIGRMPEKAYSNGISGYNWAMLPNSTGSENYGIMPDGTIFIKEAFARDCGMQSFIELKSDATGWQPAAMTLSSVNGEPAYVYKR